MNGRMTAPVLATNEQGATVLALVDVSFGGAKRRREVYDVRRWRAEKGCFHVLLGESLLPFLGRRDPCNRLGADAALRD